MVPKSYYIIVWVLMEIVYSIFIGIISSKIVSKIDGIVLQCRRNTGWAVCPFAQSKVYFVLLSCVACCVSCVRRYRLSSGVSHGAWRG